MAKRNLANLNSRHVDALARKQRAPKMTAELAREIKAIKAAVPRLRNDQIAACLGINQGRVSEVLTGKRFAED